MPFRSQSVDFVTKSASEVAKAASEVSKKSVKFFSKSQNIIGTIGVLYVCSFVIINIFYAISEEAGDAYNEIKYEAPTTKNFSVGGLEDYKVEKKEKDGKKGYIVSRNGVFLFDYYIVGRSYKHHIFIIWCIIMIIFVILFVVLYRNLCT